MDGKSRRRIGIGFLGWSTFWGYYLWMIAGCVDMVEQRRLDRKRMLAKADAKNDSKKETRSRDGED